MGRRKGTNAIFSTIKLKREIEPIFCSFLSFPESSGEATSYIIVRCFTPTLALTAVGIRKHPICEGRVTE